METRDNPRLVHPFLGIRCVADPFSLHPDPSPRTAGVLSIPRSRADSRSIGTGLFLSLMDTTIVATMLYNISEDFGGFRKSPWIVLSYTLSYVGKSSGLE